MSAPTTTAVLKEGTLSLKQAKTFFAKWKPVFVRLFSTAIAVYPASSSTSPEITFPLDAAMRVELCDTRRYAFQVAAGDQEIAFDATDDAERNAWIDQLNACIVILKSAGRPERVSDIGMAPPPPPSASAVAATSSPASQQLSDVGFQMYSPSSNQPIKENKAPAGAVAVPGAASSGFPQVRLRKTENSIRLDQPVHSEAVPPATGSPAEPARARVGTSPAINSPPAVNPADRTSRVRSLQPKPRVPPPPVTAEDDDETKLAPWQRELQKKKGRLASDQVLSPTETNNDFRASEATRRRSVTSPGDLESDIEASMQSVPPPPPPSSQQTAAPPPPPPAVPAAPPAQKAPPAPPAPPAPARAPAPPPPSVTPISTPSSVPGPSILRKTTTPAVDVAQSHGKATFGSTSPKPPVNSRDTTTPFGTPPSTAHSTTVAPAVPQRQPNPPRDKTAADSQRTSVKAAATVFGGTAASAAPAPTPTPTPAPAPPVPTHSARDIKAESTQATSKGDNPLAEFLTQYGLVQYYDIMMELEYDSLDVMLRITPEEQDEMFADIKAKPGAKKKFRFAIEDLRAQTQGGADSRISPSAVAQPAPQQLGPQVPLRREEISPRGVSTARTPPPAPKPRQPAAPAFNYGDEDDISPRSSTVDPPPRPSNVGAPPLTVRPGQRPPSFVPPADTTTRGTESRLGALPPISERPNLQNHPSYRLRPLPPMPQLDKPLMPKRMQPSVQKFDMPLTPSSRAPSISRKASKSNFFGNLFRK